MRLAAIGLLALAGSQQTYAARPMITDDARVVDAKACQVEAWTRRNRGSYELWVLPACNFTGNLELTLGGARANEAGHGRATDVIAQGKTLFRRMQTNGWGAGLVVGVDRHPDNPHSNTDPYAYVPTSFSFADDRFVLHTNVGWISERVVDRHRFTWGVGSELQLSSRAYLIPEVFGRNNGRPLFQFGIRFWVVPDHVQIDATYGNRFGLDPETRWFSIGVRLLSPTFLP